MTQSLLSVSYPVDEADKLILKTILAHPGATRGTIANEIEKAHGIPQPQTLNRIMTLITNGILTSDYGTLRPIKTLTLDDDSIHIGGA